MSTRSTIKHQMAEDGTGFHLFTDFLDDCVGREVVHLDLSGVQFDADSNGFVHVVLPKPWAEKLGLLQPSTPSES